MEHPIQTAQTKDEVETKKEKISVWTNEQN
jgi:hypothetical protein